MKYKVARDIKNLADGVQSIYLGGSRAYGAGKAGSDWDFFGVVDSQYNFENEKKLNAKLSDKYSQEIRFRGISLKELNGGQQRGVLTRHIPVQIIMKSFRFWKHLDGTKYRLENFEVSPASAKQEIKFHIKRIRNYEQEAIDGQLPFPFEDYLKTVLLLISAKQQTEGKDYTLNYKMIQERSNGLDKMLADKCMRYRNEGEIDKEVFFKELRRYLNSIDQKQY